MNKSMLIVAGLMITAQGFAQSMAEKSGTNSILGISPSTADFVKEAAISDMFEIQSSKVAEDKSDGPTKDFASQMITDHEKTSSELKGMLQTANLKVAPPTELDSSHQKMLDKLQSLNGADFTKKYQKDQIGAHKDAVSLFKRYAKSGDNPTLKQWAATTEPTLEHHLQMAKDLKKS